MARMPLTSEEVLSLLAETPRQIEGVTAGLTPTQLRLNLDEDQWSAIEILAHLRSCADVWGGCIKRILDEDHPTIKAINPRTWIKSTDYLELDFQPSFQAFFAQRTELLAILLALPQEDCSRGATVTGAGGVLQRTVSTYANSLAVHERAHAKQIARISKIYSR